MPTVRSARKPIVDRAATDEAASPGRKGISRTAVNFFLDLALLLEFAALLTITAIMRFAFPPATSSAGWTLWRWNYEEWAGGQFFVIVVFALSVLLHVMLHWSWVCGVITSRLSKWRHGPIRWEDGIRTLYGVGLLVVIVHAIALIMAIALLTVHSPAP